MNASLPLTFAVVLSLSAVVAAEEEVALGSVPAAVRAAFEQHAKKGRILLVESIAEHDAVVAYEAHIKTGGKTSEVKVSPDVSPMK